MSQHNDDAWHIRVFAKLWFDPGRRPAAEVARAIPRRDRPTQAIAPAYGTGSRQLMAGSFPTWTSKTDRYRGYGADYGEWLLSVTTAGKLTAAACPREPVLVWIVVVSNRLQVRISDQNPYKDKNPYKDDARGGPAAG